MLKETGRGKSRWKIRDLLADGMCNQEVLDFLSIMECGGAGPSRGVRGVRGVGMGVKGAGRGEESRGGGAGSRGRATSFPPHALVHGICGRGLGGGSISPFSSC